MDSDNPYLDILHSDEGASAPEAAEENEDEAPKRPNPYLDLLDPAKPVQPEGSATGAFARSAALGAIPAAGTVAGAAAGAEIGGAVGLLGGPLAPVTAPVGAFVGGLAGGFAGAEALSKAQEWGLSKLPAAWVDPLQQQLKEDQEAHPTASFIGGLAPFALTMSPSGLGKAAALPENATAMQRLMANPLTARLFGGALMGGLELAQEKLRGEDADWTNVAISTGFGVIFNRPTALGETLHGVGARAAAPISGRIAATPAAQRGRAPIAAAEVLARGADLPRKMPTLAEAQDLGVMGPGITEETFRGELDIAPEAKAQAQAARAAEMDAPELDLHALARQHEPEVFDRYDELETEREHYRGLIRDLQSPSDEMMAEAEAARDAAQQTYDDHLEARGGYTGGADARRLRAQLREAEHAVEALTARRDAWARGESADDPRISELRARLMDVDEEMRDLGRRKAAAYRHAAELGETETVAPEVEGEVSVMPEPEPQSQGEDRTVPPVTLEAVHPAPETIPPQGENPPTPSPQEGGAAASDRSFIADDVTRQLIAAGRPEDEARANGALVAARYATLSRQFKGALGSPREMYERIGAEIVGAGRAPGASTAEPIFVGGQKVEGPLAEALRKKLAEQPAPLMPTEERPNFPPPRAEAPEPQPVASVPAIPEQPAQEPQNVEPRAEAAQPAPEAAKPESVGGEIASLDPAEIHVDAERFQFKAGGDASGVTERLHGVKKWDARLAGTALVWRGADGKYWIADGHQRLGLAKRLSAEGQKVRLNAFILDSASGISDADARVIAAAKNIAEGTGTAVDAAKIIKEAEGKGIDLPPLPPRSTLVKDGEALARLSPEAFGMVVNDVVPTNQAAVVGRLVADPAQQVEAMRVLHKAAPDNVRQAEIIVRDMLATGTEDATQTSLFGEEHFASSVVLERAKVADEAAKLLRRDKTTFKTLVAEAERIQSHGANALDTEANQARLSTDEQAAQFLTQLATRRGPVSDALTGIARRFKSGEITRAAAARDFLGVVRGEIEKGVVEGDHAGGAVAGAASERELAQFEPGAEGKPQQLIPGVDPVTDRERAELAASKPMEGGNAPPPEGGLFDEDARNQTELFQSAKGKITLRVGRKPIVTLMRDADASTFIHETGHEWLQQLIRFSAHELAPEQLRQDAEIVKKWLGIKSFDDIKTRHHEKFARGFEQYMREGRAPTAALAKVFSQFRNWLLEIYRTIRGLGTPINDDIRRVFDHMIDEGQEHTVIAPEREAESPLHAMHEDEARSIEPHDAGAAADRIDAEISAQIEELPEDVRAVIGTPAEPAAGNGVTGEREAGADRAGGSGGSGSAPPRNAVPDAAEARREANPESGPVLSGVGGAAPQAGVVGEPERGHKPAAAPLDGLIPRPRETIIGEPNRISSLENLVTELGGADPEVKKYLDQLLPEKQDFNEARRGHITHGQIAEWYETAGLPPDEVQQHAIGQAFNAEQLYENFRAIKALNERIYQHARNGDVVAYERDRALRETLIEGFVGARAEAGRALSVFRRILKEMKSAAGPESDQRELFQLWREITGKDFQRSKTEAEALSKLENPAAVAQFLRNTQERTFGRMAHEYWMSAIVSNYLSQMTDVVGNFITATNKLTFEVPVAAALGAARGDAERVRLGEFGAGWRAIPGGLAPAAKAALDTMRTGQLVELPGQHLQSSLDIFAPGQRGEKLKEDAGLSDVKASAFGLITGIHDTLRAMGAIQPNAPLVKRVDTERGLIPNFELRGAEIPLGDFLRSPLNFLKSMESFSASLAFAIEKNQIAYRRAVGGGRTGAALDMRVAELLKNPPTDMLEEAVKEARVNALAYKGGPLSGALSNLVNRAEVGGWPIGKFIVPFVNISSVMMNEALLKRTPLGFLSKEIRADLVGTNGPIAQQKAQARMMVGTAIGLMGMTLAAMGKITGSPPDDPKERAVWQAAGMQPYSVRIGDSWYSYKRLGVFGLHLGVAADMFLVAEKASEKEMSDAAGTFIHAIAKNVVDQSYFKGPSDLLRAVTERGYGEYYVRNFLSGFVPFSSGMGQTAALIDPYSREARSVVDAVKAKIPFASQSLRPKVDIFGNPIPSRDPLGPFAIWVSQHSSDPVLQEMLRLKYFPAQVDRKIRGVKITDEQHSELAGIAGHTAKENLNRIIASDQWRQMPDHAKRDLLETVFRKSRETARGWMMGKYRDIPTEAARLRRIGEK